MPVALYARYEIWYGNNYHPIYSPGSEKWVVFDPQIDAEQNGSNTLTFKIPSTNPAYFELEVHGWDVIVTQGGWANGDRIFYGRIVEYRQDIDDVAEIVCEGFWAFTNDSLFYGLPYDGTIENLIRQAIASHNSQVNEDRRITLGDVIVSGSVKYEDEQPMKTKDLLDKVFEDFNLSRIETISNGSRTVGVYPTNSLDSDARWLSSQYIRKGDNLLSYTSERVSRDMYNIVVPIGKDNKRLTEGSLRNQDSIDAYGPIAAILDLNDVEDEATLRSVAQSHLDVYSWPADALTVTAIDKHLLEEDAQPIRIGYSNRLYVYKRFVNLRIRCTGMTLHLASPSSNEYKFITNYG